MRILDIFILEDEVDRYPRSQLKVVLKEHNLTIARSAISAKIIYKGPYDLLLLDHDMEGFYEDPHYPNTGYQFCKWLTLPENLPKKLPQVILHSQNTVGRLSMRTLLEKHGFDTQECAFGPLYVKLLKEQLGQ